MANKVCSGCGANLQLKDKNLPGYFDKPTDIYCRRCFRLAKYGEYRLPKIEIDYLRLIKQANIEKAKIILFVDGFHIYTSLYHKFINSINTDLVLAINKLDSLPASIKLDRYAKIITDYIGDKKYQLYFVSSSDGSYKNIIDNEISSFERNIYLLGSSGVGKSTFANYFLKHYKNDTTKLITTSRFLHNTISLIKIPLSEHNYLIDTPGFLRNSSYSTSLDNYDVISLSNISKVKETIYQLKTDESLIFDHSIALVALDNITIQCYFNEINIDKLKAKSIRDNFDKYNKNMAVDYFESLIEKEFLLDGHTDLVIVGLGFISSNRASKFKLYLPANIEIVLRERVI